MEQSERNVLFGPGCAVTYGIVLLLSGGALLLYTLSGRLRDGPAEPLAEAVGGESLALAAILIAGLALLVIGWGLATLRLWAWLALMALHTVGALGGFVGMLYPLLARLEGPSVYLTPATALMGLAVNVVALVYFWRGRALWAEEAEARPIAAYFEEDESPNPHR